MEVANEIGSMQRIIIHVPINGIESPVLIACSNKGGSVNFASGTADATARCHGRWTKTISTSITATIDCDSWVIEDGREALPLISDHFVSGKQFWIQAWSSRDVGYEGYFTATALNTPTKANNDPIDFQMTAQNAGIITRMAVNGV